MRKIYIVCLFILMITAWSCLRVTDYEITGPVSLIDSSLTTPNFSSGTSFTPANYPNDFALDGAVSAAMVFFSSSSQIHSVVLTGTTMSSETLVKDNFYPTNSVDVDYDANHGMFRVVHCYDAGGWPPMGRVAGSSVGGFTFNYNIDDMAADKVAIVRTGYYHYQISVYNPANKVFYKKIGFAGPSTQSIEPAYSSGTLNSSLFYDNSGVFDDIDDIRTANNPNTNSAIVGLSRTSGGSNVFKIITEDGDFYNCSPVYKDDGSTANKFGVASLGNNYLLAYESNLNISDQNNGNYNLDGEHIRLAIRSNAGENVDLNLGGLANPLFQQDEKSITIPLPISASDQITGVAVIHNTDATEAGLSFIKNGTLYFTKVVMVGEQLRISPLEIVDTGISGNPKIKMMYFSSRYTIVTLIGGSFKTYRALS